MKCPEGPQRKCPRIQHGKGLSLAITVVLLSYLAWLYIPFLHPVLHVTVRSDDSSRRLAHEQRLLSQFEHNSRWYHIHPDVYCYRLETLGQGGTATVYRVVCGTNASQRDFSARNAHEILEDDGIVLLSVKEIAKSGTADGSFDNFRRRQALMDACSAMAKLGQLTWIFGQDSLSLHSRASEHVEDNGALPWIEYVPRSHLRQGLILPLALARPLPNGSGFTLNTASRLTSLSGFHVGALSERIVKLCHNSLRQGDDISITKALTDLPQAVFHFEQVVLHDILYLLTTVDLPRVLGETWEEFDRHEDQSNDHTTETSAHHDEVIDITPTVFIPPSTDVAFAISRSGEPHQLSLPQTESSTPAVYTSTHNHHADKVHNEAPRDSLLLPSPPTNALARLSDESKELLSPAIQRQLEHPTQDVIKLSSFTLKYPRAQVLGYAELPMLDLSPTRDDGTDISEETSLGPQQTPATELLLDFPRAILENSRGLVPQTGVTNVPRAPAISSYVSPFYAHRRMSVAVHPFPTSQLSVDKRMLRAGERTMCALGHAIFSLLASIHSQGMVHADVKPMNIVLSCRRDHPTQAEVWHHKHTQASQRATNDTLKYNSENINPKRELMELLQSAEFDLQQDSLTAQNEVLDCLKRWTPPNPNSRACLEQGRPGCEWVPSIVAKLLDFDSAVLCRKAEKGEDAFCPIPYETLRSRHITRAYAPPELRISPSLGSAKGYFSMDSGDLAGNIISPALDVYAAAIVLLETALGTVDVFRLDRSELRRAREHSASQQKRRYSSRRANRQSGPDGVDSDDDIPFVEWTRNTCLSAKSETIDEWLRYKFGRACEHRTRPTTTSDAEFELLEGMWILAYADPYELQSRLVRLFPQAPIFATLRANAYQDRADAGLSVSLLKLLQRALDLDPSKRASAKEMAKAFAFCPSSG